MWYAEQIVQQKEDGSSIKQIADFPIRPMKPLGAKWIMEAYRKRGKIRWAKHLRFQPYKVFCGNTFAVHWPTVFIIYL